MAPLTRVGTRLLRPLGELSPLPSLPARLRLSPPWKSELETTKKHASLSAGDAAVHTLPEEPLLHRCSTRPYVQQVVFRRLVTPFHRESVDELLETAGELTVLTESLVSVLLQRPGSEAGVSPHPA